jgi:hypothetical protein
VAGAVDDLSLIPAMKGAANTPGAITIVITIDKASFLISRASFQ